MMNNLIAYRNPVLSDAIQISKLEKKVWGTDHAISQKTAESRIRLFGEGGFVACDGHRVVGAVTTTRILIPGFTKKKLKSLNRTWYDYTGNGNLSKTFDPDGNVLFGVSLTVDSEYGGRGIGTQLMLRVADYAIMNDIKAVFLGGRLPYYHKKSEMSIDEYMRYRDRSGKYYDPELRFYSKSGLKILGPVKGYYKDKESLDYGVILLWTNPFYYIGKMPIIGLGLKKILFKVFAIIKS